MTGPAGDVAAGDQEYGPSASAGADVAGCRGPAGGWDKVAGKSDTRRCGR